MSQSIINIGAQPSDGSGDPLRVSFDKINQNFTEVYSALGNISSNSSLTSVSSVSGKSGAVTLYSDDVIGVASKTYVLNLLNLSLAIGANANLANSILAELALKADTASVYTKTQIDQMLINTNDDWGLLSGDDFGLIIEPVTETENYGSII